jgi:hypothetical protein
MAYINVKTGFFLEERKKIQALNSTPLLSAVDSVEASLWLIAGGRIAQAVVLLDNAIEVALKSELERIHKILIADSKALGDFQILKSLLREAFQSHAAGSKLEIPEFDIERTIYFADAFDRVAELYPELKEKWRDRLIPTRGRNCKSLHDLRNDIVHSGGKSDQEWLRRSAKVIHSCSRRMFHLQAR